MKDVLKLALTLMIITAVSAGSLSYVHSITSVIIEDREREQAAEAIIEFFPDYADVKEEEIDADTFTVVYDEDGNLMGALVDTRARGYGGDIPYQLVIDADGEIITIMYGPNEETPGIGKKIEEEDFVNQIVGLRVDDAIELGNDIDTITDATISASAMARSIRDTMDKYAAHYLGMEVVEADPVADAIEAFFPEYALLEEETIDGCTFSQFYAEDGSLLGTLASGVAEGHEGDIYFSLVINEGEIKDVIYGDHNETPTLGDKIEEEDFVSQIVGLSADDPIESGTDIDIITGATVSSNAMVDAIRDLMDKYAANYLGR